MNQIFFHLKPKTLNYTKLKTEIDRKNYSIATMADQIGVSKNGLADMLREKRMKVSVLEEACRVLERHPAEFFDDFDLPMPITQVAEDQQRYMPRMESLLEQNNNLLAAILETVKTSDR